MPNLQRGGPCLNFAYFSMQSYNPGDPKGGAMAQWPPLNTPLPRAFLSLASRVSVLGTAVLNLGLGFFCVLGLEPCVLDSTSAYHAPAMRLVFLVRLWTFYQQSASVSNVHLFASVSLELVLQNLWKIKQPIFNFTCFITVVFCWAGVWKM